MYNGSNPCDVCVYVCMRYFVLAFRRGDSQVEFYYAISPNPLTPPNLRGEGGGRGVEMQYFNQNIQYNVLVL